MSTFGNPPTAQKRQDSRAMQALLVSVALHVAALIIIPATSAPGIPGGKGRLTQTDVFTLGYLGEWDERHDGQPSSNLGVSAIFAEGSGKSGKESSAKPKAEATATPRVATAADKRPAVPALVDAASRAESAKTLTSAKGVFAVPAEDKEKPVETPAPPKEKAGNSGAGAQMVDGHGVAGVVTGKGTGPNPPPNGAFLVQVGKVPTYPKNASNEGVEGVVGLRIHASGDGKSFTVEVSGPSGDRRLDENAALTVKGWQLKPYSQGYVLNVAVKFKGGAKVDLEYGKVELVSPGAQSNG